MSLLRQYIKDIQKSGKCYFTADNAMSELKISRKAVLNAIYRLKKTQDIISPIRKLYVVVPPAYQNIGSIPATELVPIVMQYLNREYYACLLSAAEIHGASHQKPQIFQVMTNRRMRNISCGHVVIKFLYQKYIDPDFIQNIVVNTGYLKVSTPEYTARDLFLYTNQAGGINHIATVLSELIEAINVDKFMDLASYYKSKTWVQRFGYILDNIDPMDTDKQQAILKALRRYLSKKELVYVPLTPDMPSTDCTRNKKWKIIENTTIESDI